MIRKRRLHNPSGGPKVIDLQLHGCLCTTFGKADVRVFVALEISETLSKSVTHHVLHQTRLRGHRTWKSLGTLPNSMSSFNLLYAV